MLHEVVEIAYVFIHDVQSLCIKPYMKISLMFDVIKGHLENSAFVAQLLLKLVYEVKYEDFFNTYPEIIVTALLLVLLVFG